MNLLFLDFSLTVLLWVMVTECLGTSVLSLKVAENPCPAKIRNHELRIHLSYH